jgi:hypothetical protein
MAWTKVLGFGLIAGGVALGCTVTTTSDKGDGGTGGSSSTGGNASTGGAATGGGGAATGGGGAGTGGSTAYVCSGTPPNACVGCLNTKCCTAMQACRDNATCWGSGDNVDPGSDGEFYKFHNCMTSIYNDAGTLSSSDVSSCAASAATGAVLDNTTQDVVACLGGTGDGATQCDLACYNVRIQ